MSQCNGGRGCGGGDSGGFVRNFLIYIVLEATTGRIIKSYRENRVNRVR